ncbi:MAG TPA: peptidoglycan-binding protein, partial [Roseiflexaceae bacterium]|nr:peptidoglycan-binding protein [Roseiflexaceae bacterium]
MRLIHITALLLVTCLLLGCAQTASQPTAVPAALATEAPVATQPPTLAPIPTGPLLGPTAATPAIEIRPSVTPASPATAPLAPTALASPAASPTTRPLGDTAPTLPPLERTLSLETPPLQGDDVRLLQQILLADGYRQVGAVDGIYGPQTEAAVRSFQALNGLQVDGVVGPETWQQLESLTNIQAWAVVPIVETLLCEKHLLVGASFGDQWFDNRTAGLLVHGDETYRFYTNAGPQGSAASTAVAPIEPFEPPYAEQFLVTLAPEPGQSDSIGVAGDWNAQPRRPTAVTQEADLAAYKTALIEFLRTAGIAQPSVDDAESFVVWRIDLEGDGVEEALIGASRFITSPDSSNILEGAYSVVLVQRSNGGAATIEKLVADVYPQESQVFDRSEHTPFAALDLNGDG